MTKKNYKSPTVMLTPDPDPEISFGGSQGTSGFDSMWTFEGIDEDTLALIELNCDDIDLDDMDTNDDLVITLKEFTDWYNLNQPW